MSHWTVGSSHSKIQHSPSPVLNSTGVRNPLLSRSRLSNTVSSCSGDSGSSLCSLWSEEDGSLSLYNQPQSFHPVTRDAHLHVPLCDEAFPLFVTEQKQLLGLAHGLCLWTPCCCRSGWRQWAASQIMPGAPSSKAPWSGAHWHSLATALTHQHLAIIQPLRHDWTEEHGLDEELVYICPSVYIDSKILFSGTEAGPWEISVKVWTNYPDSPQKWMGSSWPLTYPYTKFHGKLSCSFCAMLQTNRQTNTDENLTSLVQKIKIALPYSQYLTFEFVCLKHNLCIISW